MDVGQVFMVDPSAELGVRQQEKLVLLVTGTTGRHWGAPERELDLYDVLGDLGVVDSIQVAAARQQPDGMWSVNMVSVSVNGTEIGTAGQLEPALTKAFDIEEDVYVVELDLRASQKASQERKKTYKPVGQYPTVRRDLAVIVDELVSAASLIDVVAEHAKKDIYRGAEVFDVFRDEQHVGAGMKSMAVNITFRSDERTLVDEEIEASIRAIIEASQRVLGARVRGEG
jgi:phenylalanyl-tRNA synthetase beta chain